MRTLALAATLVLSAFTACDKEDKAPLKNGTILTWKENGHLTVPFIPDNPSGLCYGLYGASLTVVHTFSETGNTHCKYTPPKEAPVFYPAHPGTTNPCREGVTVWFSAERIKKLISE